MSTEVLIPFGPEVLLLTQEQFEAAREAGKQLLARATAPSVAPPASTVLVDARQLASEMSLPRSTVYEMAKAKRIPSTRIGRHVRFERSAVMAALKPAVAVTDGRL